MTIVLPPEGSVDTRTAGCMHDWWTASAGVFGVDLADFDPAAPLEQRLAWARQQGLTIAAALARFSTQMQHSTDAQFQQIVEWAGRNKCYVVPEYCCMDEATSGRKEQRAGLERMKAVLSSGATEAMLVYKVSRIMRSAYKGFAFVQEHVVDNGLRAVSISQGIDTANRHSWKMQLCLHGLMDDMLLETIADHVRAGLHHLFEGGYTTGALPVGYRPVEVPGAAPTNRGLPRTRPGVDEAAAGMIVRHFEYVRDGMSISKGWQKWLEEGGPYDPRATTKEMSYPAYRRMLSNPRYTGVWAFGKKKNSWSSKHECNHQIEQPESEVRIYQCDELRIVSDELFHNVQARLAGFQRGPRPWRKDKPIELWDLTTGLFYCAACSCPEDLVRYYQTGARGLGMQCKNGHRCPALSALPRKKAIALVCAKLQELLRRDEDLIKEIICAAETLDAESVDDRTKLIRQAEVAIRSSGTRISNLQDMLGEGTDDDRRGVKDKIRAAQLERQGQQLELQRLQRTSASAPITAKDVDRILSDLGALLSDASSGKLGDDAAHRAFRIFELLVGGKIMVHVDARAGRKRKNARGVFTPNLIAAVNEVGSGDPNVCSEQPSEVEVWLREPPFIDLWAARARELVDLRGESYRSAATIMNREDGLKINSGKVWQLRKRYYEMRGEAAPEREYNNGHRRKSA